jgi:hypothetical protein
MERIIFYLHFANNRNEFAAQHPNSYLTVLRKCAYKELLERLLNTHNLRVDVYFRGNGDDVAIFVEIIRKITVFFCEPFNSPKEGEAETPKYRKAIAFDLTTIRGTQFSDFIDSFVSKSVSANIHLNKDDIISVCKQATRALVVCCLYQSIVDEKMFDAMEYLAEVAPSEDTFALPRFLEQKAALEAEQDRKTLEILCDMNLVATHKITNAQDAWLRLWALKTLKKLQDEESLHEKPTGQMRPKF